MDRSVFGAKPPTPRAPVDFPVRFNTVAEPDEHGDDGTQNEQHPRHARPAAPHCESKHSGGDKQYAGQQNRRAKRAVPVVKQSVQHPLETLTQHDAGHTESVRQGSA